MQTDIHFSPSFAVALVRLAPGEAVRNGAGAMLSMTDTVEILTHTQGGIMRGLRRSVLGGESFFMNTFTATGPDAEVSFAPALHRPAVQRPLHDEGLVCRLTGPGRIHPQTRSPEGFLAWLVPRLPTNRS